MKLSKVKGTNKIYCNTETEETESTGLGDCQGNGDKGETREGSRLGREHQSPQKSGLGQECRPQTWARGAGTRARVGLRCVAELQFQWRTLCGGSGVALVGPRREGPVSEHTWARRSRLTFQRFLHRNALALAELRRDLRRPLMLLTPQALRSGDCGDT